MSFDADPSTGVSVYDSYNNGSTTPWVEAGGTSLSATCWAGLIAIADQGRVAAGGTTLDGPSQTLPALYSLPAAISTISSPAATANTTPAPGMIWSPASVHPRPMCSVSDLASYELGSQLVVSSQPPRISPQAARSDSRSPQWIASGMSRHRSTAP